MTAVFGHMRTRKAKNMEIEQALKWADTWGSVPSHPPSGDAQALMALASEVRKLRVCLREHAKWADKAAMVVATIEAENDDEHEQLHAIVEGISAWAPDAIMGPNVALRGEPLAASPSRK